MTLFEWLTVPLIVVAALESLLVLSGLVAELSRMTWELIKR